MTETASTGETSEEVVEPQTLKSPRESRVVLVETKEALQSAAEVLGAATGLFAVDAERASGFKYSQRAYLIQVHRRGTPIFLIDPAALSPDISDAPEVFFELAQVMQGAPWILHSASHGILCDNPRLDFPKIIAR